MPTVSTLKVDINVVASMVSLETASTAQVLNTHLTYVVGTPYIDQKVR